MAVYKAKNLKNWDTDTQHNVTDEWIPARPINYLIDRRIGRVVSAWKVLTGKYDALDWEDD